MEYDAWVGDVKKSNKGALISTAQGTSTTYSLRDIEPKGTLFIGPNTPVYGGMVIGEHNLEKDLEMNPVKSKELNNIRVKGKEDTITLVAPRLVTLEEAVANLREDELVEVTPKWTRIRK
jgi:GTP-binding protein